MRFDPSPFLERTPRGLRMPWPQKPSKSIYPLFLPFWGCPQKCVFCAQEDQTGQKSAHTLERLKIMLGQCEADLKLAREKGRPCDEIAFYGGTFTALPESAWKLCLEFARKSLAEGLISSFRCSTRPDALSPERLKELADSGCHLVELGIQSFNDAALAKSGRGLTGRQCRDACALPGKFGLKTGIQLLPGMPGCDPRIFLEDVDLAIELQAHCLRFYPCLVFRNTRLAQWWKNGLYKPWRLKPTLNILSRAWTRAACHGISVIRMGLAPQAGMEEAILAGPRHPSLGAIVMAVALEKMVRRMAKILGGNTSEMRLLLPDNARGYFLGWKGLLKSSWEKLGFGTINFIQDNCLILQKI